MSVRKILAYTVLGAMLATPLMYSAPQAGQGQKKKGGHKGGKKGGKKGPAKKGGGGGA